VGVESFEGFPVPVDREVRDPPDALAQDVDDCTDVEELHPAARGAQVHDLQSHRPGCRGLTLGIAASPLPRLRPEEPLDELEGRIRSDMLGKVGAAVDQNAGDLRPVGTDRMAAAHQLKAGIGKL